MNRDGTSDALDRLFTAILEARLERPALSRTARLIQEGLPKMARKVVEESVEVVLEAVQGERQKVVEESADLVYNLAVLWAEMGISPADIWGEMEWRERTFGIAGKLPKDASGRR